MTLKLTLLSDKGAWKVFSLPVSLFPMPEAELPVARSFVQKLITAFENEHKLQLETFVQVTELHQGNGVDRLSRNGAKWIPAIGLGVWPDRPVPGLWTVEMVQELKVGENPPTSFFNVFRVTAQGMAIRREACDTMLGLGSILFTMNPGGSEEYLSRTRQVLFPLLPPPIYTSFPFYVPMFDASSLRNASEQQLDTWCCGSSLYVRESHNDGAILIAMNSADRVMNRLECQPDPDTVGTWIVKK